jgi:hypothetical protein
VLHQIFFRQLLCSCSCSAGLLVRRRPGEAYGLLPPAGPRGLPKGQSGRTLWWPAPRIFGNIFSLAVPPNHTLAHIDRPPSGVSYGLGPPPPPPPPTTHKILIPGAAKEKKKKLVPSALRRTTAPPHFASSQSGGRGASPAGDPSENRRFPLLLLILKSRFGGLSPPHRAPSLLRCNAT